MEPCIFTYATYRLDEFIDAHICQVIVIDGGATPSSFTAYNIATGRVLLRAIDASRKVYQRVRSE